MVLYSETLKQTCSNTYLLFIIVYYVLIDKLIDDHLFVLIWWEKIVTTISLFFFSFSNKQPIDQQVEIIELELIKREQIVFWWVCEIIKV